MPKIVEVEIVIDRDCGILKTSFGKDWVGSTVRLLGQQFISSLEVSRGRVEGRSGVEVLKAFKSFKVGSDFKISRGRSRKASKVFRVESLKALGRDKQSLSYLFAAIQIFEIVWTLHEVLFPCFVVFVCSFFCRMSVSVCRSLGVLFERAMSFPEMHLTLI